MEKLEFWPPGTERAEVVRQHFDKETADKLNRLEDSDYVEDNPVEWTSEDGAKEVASGFFVYASYIDWDAGTLRAELLSGTEPDQDLFWGAGEHLASEFKTPDFSVSLKGLYFERNVIEMLQPGVELATEKRERIEPRARSGRPRVWDWDGATMHLLKLAQHPDGLPTGSGAQAHIERLISEWFAETTGNAPSASQVRQHAARIMQAIRMPESR